MNDRDKTEDQLNADPASPRQHPAAIGKEEYGLLMELLPHPVWRCNPEGGVIECNRRWCEYTGQTEEQARGNGWMNALHPDDLARVAEQVKSDAAGGELYHTEYRLRRASDDSYRWHVARAMPMRDENGDIAFWFGSAADIHDQKQADAALRKSRDELDLRVRERTAELEEANQQLNEEIQRRQQAEDSLRASEEKYRTLVEASPDAVVMSDMTGQVLFASQRAVELLGFDSPEELRTKKTLDFVVEEEQPKLVRNLSHLSEAGLRRGTEYAGVRKDGTRFPVEVSSVLIRDDAGRPKSVMAVVRDITERKRTEEALLESEEKYRTLLEASPDSVILTDLEGRIVFASRQAVELYGADCAEEMYGREATCFMAPEERQRVEESMEKLRREGLHRNLEYTLLAKDGTRIPGELSSAVVRDAAGRPKGLVAVARDITERKRAQEALERERETLLHMLRASDHERQVISYDIHDGLAQQLAAATMRFQANDYLKEQSPAEAQAAYDAGVEMVRQAHSEARRLISGVRPPALDEAGILMAISHLTHEKRKPGEPQIEYYDDVEFDRLLPILENTIYRITQEALANACKHSRSEKVKVSLVQEDGLLRLQVQDWGVGFDPKSADDDSFGLEGMKERARLLGGKCSIESEPGKGTSVRVVLPIMDNE